MKTLNIWRALSCYLFAATLAQAQSTNEFAELIPPYAELPPTFWEQYGLVLSLAFLAGLALIGATVWMISRPRPAPILPPEVQARRALEALRAQPENGALLSQVSQVFRRYVSAAFGLPPGELTTQELIAAMESAQNPEQPLRQTIRLFLEMCDARKFAPASPTPPQNAVSVALTLVEQGESLRAARKAGQSQSRA